MHHIWRMIIMKGEMWHPALNGSIKIMNKPIETWSVSEELIRCVMVIETIMSVNSLSTSDSLLIMLANSLDPDQARRIVGPDQGPICLTFW